MRTRPQIKKFMTFIPKSIAFDQTIAQAADFMRKLRLRHLPVIKGGELVGVITDRDIDRALGIKNANAETLKVEDACTFDPYVTTPQASLSEVVEQMAEYKHECALVVDNGKLVGIFTETDARRVLADLLPSKSL